MRIFTNAVVLEGEGLEKTRGYLVIREGIIEKIGRGIPPKSGSAIDLKGGFVLPPFVNSHTHIADSVAKEIYLGKTQAEVVGPKGEKFRVLSSRSKNEIVAAIRSTLTDMIKSGTLAHCDFRESGAPGVKLLRSASNQQIISVILGRPSKPQEIDEVLKYSNGIGLPSLDAFKKSVLHKLARKVKASGKHLATHVAETKFAQESSLKKFGKSEIERAMELGPSFLIHGTWANEQDLELMRKKGIPIVFCSRANSIFSCGSPPLDLALSIGMRFCIGTDNVTAVQPDMFEELAFAWTLLRKTDARIGAEEARKLLRAATIEPLSVFNLPWGPVQEGERAVFMILSRGNNLVNLSDIYAGLVNRARASNIKEICLGDQ